MHDDRKIQDLMKNNYMYRISHDELKKKIDGNIFEKIDILLNRKTCINIEIRGCVVINEKDISNLDLVNKDDLIIKHIKIDISIIEKKKRPNFVWIILKNLDELEKLDIEDVYNIIRLLVWNKNISSIIKNNKNIIDVLILNRDKDKTENLLNIVRINVNYNTIETTFCEGNNIKLKDIVNIKSCYNKSSIFKCCICYDDICSNMYVINECKHGICIRCTGKLLSENNGKCPLCRTSLNKNSIILQRYYTPSFYDAIASTLDDIKDGINIIYMEKNHIKGLHDRINYIENLIVLEKCNNKLDKLIKKINDNNITILTVNENNDLISGIDNIKNIITLSTNTDILINKKSYGNDFINKNKMVNLYIININF